MSDRPIDRRTVLGATGAGVVTLVAGCVSTTDDGDGETETTTDDGSGEPYTVGVVNSQTGSLSAFGERNARGLELALRDVNETTIGGRELDVTVEDSESTTSAGVSAAQKLANQDGVPFLIGAVGSGVSLGIYDSVVSGTDVVQLSQNSTGTDLSNSPGLLRMSPPGGVQSAALASLVSDDDHESVALAWVNNDYGQGLAETFREEWDGEIAYDEPHDQGASSYASVVSSMNSSGADAWVFITYQPEFTTMAQEAYSNGYEAAYYGADSVQGPDVLADTPDGSLEEMQVVVPSAAVDQENYQEFAAAFQSEYDRQPTSWAAFMYDCVITAALSIATAEEFTGSALQETVRDVTRPEGEEVFTFAEAMDVLGEDGAAADIDYQGVSGPIDFDENGDPTGFLQVLTVQDHEYVQTDTVRE